LSKSHAEKLVETGKRADVVVTIVSDYALPEFLHRQEIHDLRENRLAMIHWRPPSAEGRVSSVEAISNRFARADVLCDAFSAP
jgi:hypothetical protein